MKRGSKFDDSEFQENGENNFMNLNLNTNTKT